MSAFYVGQRVRIKWSEGWPELAGQEGRIVQRVKDASRHRDCEWNVAPDCWGTHRAPHPSERGGTCFGPNSRQLEPITPPHEAGDWHEIDKLLPNLRGVPA